MVLIEKNPITWINNPKPQSNVIAMMVIDLDRMPVTRKKTDSGINV